MNKKEEKTLKKTQKDQRLVFDLMYFRHLEVEMK